MLGFGSILKVAGRAFALVVLGACFGVIWFGLSSTADDLTDGSETLPSVVATAEMGERVQTVPGRIEFSRPSYQVVSLRGGIVTSAPDLGAEIGPVPTQVLVSIDDRPTLVSRYVPSSAFWRDIRRSDSGQDVRTFQEYLIATGNLQEPSDGKFGRSTQNAWRSWQKAVGVDLGNTLRLGDLVFVDPELGDVVVRDQIVGSRVGLGDSLAVVQSQDLAIVLTVESAIANRVSVDDQVVADGFTGRVTQRLDSVVVDGATLVRYEVEGELDRAALDGETIAVRVSSPEKPSLWIPSAAVAADETGAPFVVTETGDRLTVELGRSFGNETQVIAGLSKGQTMVVPHPETTLP